MDTLKLYKGKLDDALTLVPSMCQDNKRKAVDYWNVVAHQLEVIIHEDGSPTGGYRQTSSESSSLNAHSGEDHSSSDYDVIECRETATIDASHHDEHSDVIASLSTSPSTDPTLIASTIKQTAVSQFHQSNLLNKTIYETTYLGHSPDSLIEERGDHDDSLSASSDTTNKPSTTITSSNSSMNVPSTNYEIISAQSNITCVTGNSIVPSTSCNSNGPRTATITDNAYAQVRHTSILPQVSNNQLDLSSKTLIVPSSCDGSGDVFCGTSSSGHNNQVSQMFSFVSNTTAASATSALNDKKMSQNTNDSPQNSDYQNILITGALSCPRTTANVTHEIGNGQFDRGPKMFNDNLVTQFMPVTTSTNISLDQAMNHDNVVVSHRNELFTHSDRPLQQIQFLDLHQNNDYFGGHTYSFNNANDNTIHDIESHNRIKLLTCSICDEHLGSHDELVQHQQMHSSTSAKDLSPSTSPSSSTSSSNIQDMQLYPSSSSSETLKNTDSPKRIQGDGGVQHSCIVCGKSGFSTKGNLKRHLRAHSGEKPFKCEWCDSCFTEKKSLKIHVRRHTGEKPYKCQVCEKSFSQTGVLQSHMALHLNERKFECSRCNKAFRQRSQLKLHLMRHEGIKRLECSTCRARFLTKGDLERHCRIHTGERPYTCKICSKSFTRQQSLNEHMNRHTGRKPYDCKYCDKTFSEMSACYKHAKTHKKHEQSNQQRVDQ